MVAEFPTSPIVHLDDVLNTLVDQIGEEHRAALHEALHSAYALGRTSLSYEAAQRVLKAMPRVLEVAGAS
jgi:hypothetical protein